MAPAFTLNVPLAMASRMACTLAVSTSLVVLEPSPSERTDLETVTGTPDWAVRPLACTDSAAVPTCFCWAFWAVVCWSLLASISMLLLVPTFIFFLRSVFYR